MASGENESVISKSVKIICSESCENAGENSGLPG